MPAIEASELTKVYRTYRKELGLWGSIKGLVRRRYDETRAADQVSFQIEEGEFVGFLGPNGAGKTTVLKMLSGLLNPTSGDARVLGFVPWERRNEMKRQFSLLMGAVVGPAGTRIARAQPRDLRNRPAPVRQGSRWIVRAFGS
jgi:ABC-2 type transport system ATP-binding protein